MGAPVYFVVRENQMNYTSPAVQKKLCGGLGCDVDSLVTQIYLASKSKNRSYIASTPASWIDDYLDWFRIPSCCRVDDESGEFCPASKPGGDFCTPCQKTFIDEEQLWPDAETFNRWLPDWIADNPCQDCPKGGHAAYGNVRLFLFQNINCHNLLIY